MPLVDRASQEMRAHVGGEGMDPARVDLQFLQDGLPEFMEPVCQSVFGSSCLPRMAAVRASRASSVRPAATSIARDVPRRWFPEAHRQ